MREAFPAYSRTTTELKKLWKDAIFSFDANVLLNLYESADDTATQFFDVLEQFKDRIWLSNQAALEFYDNRVGLIQRGRAQLSKLEDLSKQCPHFVRVSTAKKITSLLNTEAEYLQEFLEQDPIESRLNTIFDGRVGKAYKDMGERYEQAERRFQLRIPPGFSDVSKGDYKKYGDVILWFQLLDFAREKQRPVILITSEKKIDWYQVGDHKAKLGPRPELVQEMKAVAGTAFHMYSPAEFLKHANDTLKIQPTPEKVEEAVDDLLRIEQQNETVTLTPSNVWWFPTQSNIIYGVNNRQSVLQNQGVLWAPGQTGVFPNSNAAYTIYSSGIDSGPTLFDSEGHVISPVPSSLFFTLSPESASISYPQSQSEKREEKRQTLEEKKKQD